LEGATLSPFYWFCQRFGFALKTVSVWWFFLLKYDFANTILPVPVFLKRFAADRFVFIFGIFSSPLFQFFICYSLAKGQNCDGKVKISNSNTYGASHRQIQAHAIFMKKQSTWQHFVTKRFAYLLQKRIV
jgi:hypothetical protein